MFLLFQYCDNTQLWKFWFSKILHKKKKNNIYGQTRIKSVMGPEA